MIETIKIRWYVNIHFLSECATICIAALNVRLTMQKLPLLLTLLTHVHVGKKFDTKSRHPEARNRPLTPFLLRQSNIQNYSADRPTAESRLYD